MAAPNSALSCMVRMSAHGFGHIEKLGKTLTARHHFNFGHGSFDKRVLADFLRTVRDLDIAPPNKAAARTNRRDSKTGRITPDRPANWTWRKKAPAAAK